MTLDPWTDEDYYPPEPAPSAAYNIRATASDREIAEGLVRALDARVDPATRADKAKALFLLACIPGLLLVLTAFYFLTKS